MNRPVSPLFPASSLAGAPDDAEYLLPQLPETPLVLTSSIQMFIVPTEKHLFVQGFKPSEFEGLPPTLLRGCLVLRVTKPTKLKSISLQFKGTQRTEWPEGIPPKKNIYSETNDVVAHTWPFYHMETPVPSCGADLYVPARGAHDDVSHLTLDHGSTVALPLLAPMDLAASFAASLIKRATSPLGGVLTSTHSLAPSDSMADLTAVLSSLSLNTMGDMLKPGYFAPGDYVYNFEHPIPALSPETVAVNFGRVSYHLECTLARVGAFKPNLTGRLPVEVVRIPSDNSVEENEPIVIERDWEDQLQYEIVVGSKAIVLDLYVPLVFRFIPLYGKVALHRIRVYLTETCNYYCCNKTVHREEPMKKFLLLEHKAKKNKSLLLKSGGMTEEVIENDEVLPRELEFQMFVPSMINRKYNYCIHPDTSFETIKCEHWIKISLRISKQDPTNPEKRKHFEILIDSPIHLCSPLAAHCNTLLPAYDMEPEFLPRYTPSSPPMSPDVTPVDCLHQHAGHLILLALSGIGGNSSKPSPPPLRSSTPIEFRHISSMDNNDEPIERDRDVHLEANLYRPLEPEVLDALGTPQAQPFSPVASPTMRPLGSPVTPVPRGPSMQPPAFDDVGAADQTLPPAYFTLGLALSLSPLRIDVPSQTNKSPARKSKLLVSPAATGIKSMLNKQLDNLGRSSDRESLRSTASSNSKKSWDERSSVDSKERPRKDRGAEKPSLASDTSESVSLFHGQASGEEPSVGKKAKRLARSEPVLGAHGASDVTVSGASEPALAGGATSGSGTSSSTVPNTAGPGSVIPVSTVSAPVSAVSVPSGGATSEPPILAYNHSTVMTHAVSGLQSTCADDLDIADIQSHFHTPSHLRVEDAAAMSRRSSVSLAALSGDEAPLDQTLPLLSISSTSVNDIDAEQFDPARRPSTGGSMSDLVDAALFGHDNYNISGSLFTLRNPRIAKHYQATDDDDPGPKPRQKSFGVIPEALRNRSLTGSSEGSEMTVNAIASSNSSKADAYIEPVDLQEVASQ